MENEEIVETPVQETQEELIEEIVNEEVEVIEEKRETLKLPEKEDDSVEIEGVKYPKDIVEKAKQGGWREKSFLEKIGMGEKYLDPKTFKERGDKTVPFLNNKLEKIEKENTVLKNLVKKQISDTVKDRMENVEKQIKEAKEYGEYDNVERLIEKKLQLQGELSNYSKEEVQQPQIPNKPLEITSWEARNDWCIRNFGDEYNPNFDEDRTIKAQELFVKIGKISPHLSLNDRLKIVDDNLSDLDNRSRQKANVAPPIQGIPTSAITPNNRKTFENLTYTARKIFDEMCTGVDGKPFTGEAMKIAKASFLERCDNESFKK